MILHIHSLTHFSYVRSDNRINAASGRKEGTKKGANLYLALLRHPSQVVCEIYCTLLLLLRNLEKDAREKFLKFRPREGESCHNDWNMVMPTLLIERSKGKEPTEKVAFAFGLLSEKSI